MSKKREPTAGSFKPGEGGRPKGARNKFAAQFIKDVAKSWAIDGPEVLESIKGSDKSAYVRTVAALVPKDMDINHSGNISISVVDYDEDDNGL